MPVPTSRTPHLTRPGPLLRVLALWESLVDALAELAQRDGRCPTVLDLGGGTGGFAVPLAHLGYPVTVVDPSPDALAALARRAVETGVAEHVTGSQGDAADIVELLGPAGVDVVLCHAVLEVVDDPAETLAAVAAVLRPGGCASILAANRVAAVVARVAAGRVAEARRLFTSPTGSSGPGDPAVRRFTSTELETLVREAGLVPRRLQGVRIFSEVVPTNQLDSDAAVREELAALEIAAAADPAYTAVAAQLHVLADRT